MILAPFEGPRLKIKRGYKHIFELTDVLAEYSKSVELIMVPINETENHITYQLRFSLEPPSEIPSLIGDSVHNLRTSLDILMCDIARLRGRDANNLRFPFASTKLGLEEILDKHVKHLGNDIVDEIRALAPYKDGNISLRGLHDLDIADKHRMVLPYYLVAHSRIILPPEMLSVMNAVGVNFGSMSYPMTAGTRQTFAKGVNPWSYMAPIEGGPQPTFPEGLPFAEAAIVPVLNHLANVAEKIVEVFASKFGIGNNIPQ